MFTIRHYIDDDLDEVIALWYRSWTYAFPNVKHPQPRLLTLMEFGRFWFMQLLCHHKIRANSRLPLPNIFFCTTDFP
jgi:hypothetical protein